jgi:cell division protein YceG involved in septum cleavage
MAVQKNGPKKPGARGAWYNFGPKGYSVIGGVFFVLGFLLFLPALIRYESAPRSNGQPFPVTVNPATKTITTDPRVEAMLNASSTLTASIFGVEGLFVHLGAAAINAEPYQALTGGQTKAVVIKPGYRKEQVAHAFGTALEWSPAEEAAFLLNVATSTPTLAEGQFDAGTYVVSASTSPKEVQEMINEQFVADIASRYSSSTQALVPMNVALNIASLIEREAGNADQMRMISGIIWNRIFADMKLQLDASVQYAKAKGTNGVWWPTVKPTDLSIQSPYNTYKFHGLPPTPIATPSVAAVLAALNPKQTDCVYYFHDSKGGFHCSATYAEHVALLKKYYGRGK